MTGFDDLLGAIGAAIDLILGAPPLYFPKIALLIFLLGVVVVNIPARSVAESLHSLMVASPIAIVLWGFGAAGCLALLFPAFQIGALIVFSARTFEGLCLGRVLRRRAKTFIVAFAVLYVLTLFVSVRIPPPYLVIVQLIWTALGIGIVAHTYCAELAAADRAKPSQQFLPGMILILVGAHLFLPAHPQFALLYVSALVVGVYVEIVCRPLLDAFRRRPTTIWPVRHLALASLVFAPALGAFGGPVVIYIAEFDNETVIRGFENDLGHWRSAWRGPSPTQLGLERFMEIRRDLAAQEFFKQVDIQMLLVSTASSFGFAFLGGTVCTLVGAVRYRRALTAERGPPPDRADAQAWRRDALTLALVVGVVVCVPWVGERVYPKSKNTGDRRILNAGQPVYLPPELVRSEADRTIVVNPLYLDRTYNSNANELLSVTTEIVRGDGVAQLAVAFDGSFQFVGDGDYETDGTAFILVDEECLRVLHEPLIFWELKTRPGPPFKLGRDRVESLFHNWTTLEFAPTSYRGIYVAQVSFARRRSDPKIFDNDLIILDYKRDRGLTVVAFWLRRGGSGGDSPFLHESSQE